MSNGNSLGRHLLEYDPQRFNIALEDFLELRARSSEFVFIVGSARSATTIMAEIVNMHSDCMMLMEDNPFINHYIKDYVGWYRHMTQEAGCKMAKGFYLPGFCSNNIGWAKLYLLLKDQYRLVGGKVAFGPHGYWENVQNNFLDFYISLFPAATYFGCLRHPVESMAIMFKDRSLKQLLETWIYSVIYLVYMSCLVDRFYLIVNENLSEKFLNTVLGQAGVGQLDYLDKIINPKKYANSQFSHFLCKAPLSALLDDKPKEWHKLFKAALELYYELCANFDENSCVLKPECQRTQFSAIMDRRLRELLWQVHSL